MSEDRIMDIITVWAPVALVILSAINAATKHYTKFNGLLKILMEVIERLSLLSSKNTAGRFKLLGTSVLPDAAIERMSNAQKQLKRVAKVQEAYRDSLARRR